VWVPTIAAAQKINKEMTKQGCNLLSDGRPIIGLSLINLAELVLTAEPNALIVPAHIYTPWFSVFGKMGGFESLEEAFGPYAKHIHAVETGLSSSPDMNWRIKELDLRAIISSSDAHSGAKLGREATVFEIDEHQMKECDEHMITYDDLSKALRRNTQKTRNCSENSDNSDNQIIRKSENQSVRQSENLILRPSEHSEFSGPRISYTIEFYPEEGKYHYTGHRDCNVRLTPEEVVKKGTTCSVCGKPLTQGVMQRVEEIASRSSNEVRVTSYEFNSIRMLKTEEQRNRPPFVMLVPLQEIIAEAIGSPVASKKTQAHYETLVSHFGGEFTILLHADLKEITKIGTVEIADGVRKVRKGDIIIDPGYDGVFGVVKIWKSDKEKSLVDGSKEQLGLF
jgi:PHP family Zn ribbon phosphoesterase